MTYKVILPLLGFLALFSPTAEAADLPPSLDKMISAAAARDVASGDFQYLEVSLVLIAESQPEFAKAATALAIELAPQFKSVIIATLVPEEDGQVITAVALAPPAPTPVAAKPPEEPKVEEPLPDGFWSFKNWKGELQLGLSIRRGGTVEDEITLGIELKNERKKWTHKTRVRYELLKKDKVVDEDDLLVSYQLDRILSDRLYVYGLLLYRDEYNNGFDRRFLQNLGMGYHVLKDRKFNLSLEAGPSHRKSSLTSMQGSQHEWGGRVTLNADWDIASWLQMAFKGSTTFTNLNNSYETLLTLTSPLTKRLSARLSIEYDFDTDVPEGDFPDDLRTRMTLIYGF